MQEQNYEKAYQYAVSIGHQAEEVDGIPCLSLIYPAHIWTANGPALREDLMQIKLTELSLDKDYFYGRFPKDYVSRSKK